MARFAANVIGSNLVGFLYRKLDVFLVGFFLDPRQLGYYYLVQRLVMTTGLVTLSTVQSIVMPVLSRLQAEPARFRQVYGSAVQTVQAIYLPAVVGLGAVGSTLIPFVFGAQWQPAVPLLEIMCLVGFTQALSFFSGPALWAAGHPEAFLRLSVIQVAVTALLFLPATQFGITGVAAAYTAVSAVIIPFHLWFVRRHAGVDPVDLLKRCLPSAAAGLAMIFAVEFAEQSIVPDWSPLVASVSLAALGAGVYLLALTAASPGFVKEVLALLFAALGRRESTAPREQAAAGGTAS
jgi:PST family polysaccharide transporter